MQTIAEIRLANLERLIKEMGTQDRVAEFGSTSSVYLSQIRNSAPDSKTGKLRVMGDEMARKLEIGCNKPRGWMDNFRSEEEAAIAKLYSGLASDVHHFVQQSRAEYNVVPVAFLAKIPVLSWVQAGEFSEEHDPYPEGAVEDWVNSPVKAGSRAFALKVRGQSMYNPTGKPSFSEGDIIFCDPDRNAQHKSLVICRLDDQKEATFKRLLIEGDTKMLEALNPSWPERIIRINGNATICGVVFGRYDGF